MQERKVLNPTRHKGLYSIFKTDFMTKVDGYAAVVFRSDSAYEIMDISDKLEQIPFTRIKRKQRDEAGFYEVSANIPIGEYERIKSELTFKIETK